MVDYENDDFERDLHYDFNNSYYDDELSDDSNRGGLIERYKNKFIAHYQNKLKEKVIESFAKFTCLSIIEK